MTTWWEETFPAGRQTLSIEDEGGRRVAIAYGEIGSGPPLVLVHGLGVWSYCWRRMVVPLSQHFRVICFDAVGSGFSEKPLYPLTLGHQVVELAAVINTLCDRPPIVIAESLGALTSLGLAIESPERVERLVLINVPIFPKRLPSQGMRVLAAIPQPLVHWVDQQRLFKRFSPLVYWLSKRARREVVVDPTDIKDDEIRQSTYPYVELPGTLSKFSEDLKLAFHEIEDLLNGRPSRIQQIQQALPGLTCPTLILWGDRDHWFPPEDGIELHRHLPNATLKILPNCGHQASVEGSAGVVQAILDYLERTESTAAEAQGAVHP
ncbi:MAG: alpha/beta fold hydrolase [Elainellaceae cyanobacterium]